MHSNEVLLTGESGALAGHSRLVQRLRRRYAAELALLTACIDAGLWPDLPACLPDPALAVALAPECPPRLRFILAQILGFGGGHAALVLEDTHGSPS